MLVYGELRRQGFTVKDGEIEHSPATDKSGLRALHLGARGDKAVRELRRVGRLEKELVAEFASGRELTPEDIRPAIYPVATGTRDAVLYNYASLLWSVPVSQGFGRRQRFLVRDESNGKLIGLFALGDPVFNLRCRDQHIGWTTDQRERRLYNVMDVFVLGAVPPYSLLLGGKLIAYVAASNEVRKWMEQKYRATKTVIRNETKDPTLALLTTSSALGKSALYARLKYGGKDLYQRIGATNGWGHFHLNHGLFQHLATTLDKHRPGHATKNRYGNGPNWKIRTAREALTMAGLPPSLIRHGISREVFIINVSENGPEFLRGEESAVVPRDLPLSKLIQFWRERWLVNRVERRPEFREHRLSDIPRLVRSGTEFRTPRFPRLDEWSNER